MPRILPWIASTFMAVVLFLATPAQAWEGLVIGVHDGDTITVLNWDLETVKVRLADVDCPELDQPWGYMAKWYTMYQCLARFVDVEQRGYDRRV